VIEVEALNVFFGRGRDEVHAVQDVSFRVADGESFGLVGESGSGKSTVLRAFCGLNPHWTGRMTVEGVELRPHRDKAFYKLTARCIRAIPWTESCPNPSPSTA
jgi:peptide/nickel transport system ATP-binding protein